MSTTSPTTPEGLDELDALLAQAMAGKAAATARKAEEDARKAAKSRLARGLGTASERAADAALISQWELANEWDSTAVVAVYHRYSCPCGHHQTVFEGCMIRQEHRRLRETHRLTAIAFQDIPQDLPKEVAIRKTDAAMCVRCSWAEGFPFHNVTYWEI